MSYWVPELKKAGAWLDWRTQYPGGTKWRAVRNLSIVKKLVVHHTVTNPTGNAKSEVDLIKRIHIDKNKWGGIGYHFIITTDIVNGYAKVAYVGDIKTVRAHAPNYKGAAGIPAKHGNTYTIGMAFIGQLHKHMPTKEQLLSGHLLAKELIYVDNAVLPNLKDWSDLIPHRMLDKTACPGMWDDYKDSIHNRIELISEEEKLKRKIAELEETIKTLMSTNSTQLEALQKVRNERDNAKAELNNISRDLKELQENLQVMINKERTELKLQLEEEHLVKLSNIEDAHKEELGKKNVIIEELQQSYEVEKEQVKSLQRRVEILTTSLNDVKELLNKENCSSSKINDQIDRIQEEISKILSEEVVKVGNSLLSEIFSRIEDTVRKLFGIYRK